MSSKPVNKSASDEPIGGIEESTSQGELLRIFRELRGLSQLELSKLTGIPEATLESIEAGIYKMGAQRGAVLARVLRVPLVALLIGAPRPGHDA